jgi:hypothetical protein
MTYLLFWIAHSKPLHLTVESEYAPDQSSLHHGG